MKSVYTAPELQMKDIIANAKLHERIVRVQYGDNKTYHIGAKQFGIMQDLKVIGKITSSYS